MERECFSSQIPWRFHFPQNLTISLGRTEALLTISTKKQEVPFFFRLLVKVLIIKYILSCLDLRSLPTLLCSNLLYSTFNSALFSPPRQYKNCCCRLGSVRYHTVENNAISSPVVVLEQQTDYYSSISLKTSSQTRTTVSFTKNETKRNQTKPNQTNRLPNYFMKTTATILVKINLTAREQRTKL